MNQWRKRINKIAASFEHANKHEAQHEPALQLSGSGASSLAGSSSSSNSKNSSSREAEGHKSQQDADKQRKASHAQASTSNEQSTVSSRSQSPAANTAEVRKSCFSPSTSVPCETKLALSWLSVYISMSSIPEPSGHKAQYRAALQSRPASPWLCPAMAFSLSNFRHCCQYALCRYCAGNLPLHDVSRVTVQE